MDSVVVKDSDKSRMVLLLTATDYCQAVPIFAPCVIIYRPLRGTGNFIVQKVRTDQHEDSPAVFADRSPYEQLNFFGACALIAQEDLVSGRQGQVFILHVY